MHERETEPKGERKGAGRGEGGLAQTAQLQLCRKQRGPRGGQLRESVKTNKHQTEITTPKPKVKFVSTLLSNFPYNIFSSFTMKFSILILKRRF